MRTKSGFLVLFWMLMLSFPSGGREADRYHWLTDLEAARQLAGAERKPMLIVFRCEP